MFLVQLVAKYLFKNVNHNVVVILLFNILREYQYSTSMGKTFFNHEIRVHILFSVMQSLPDPRLSDIFEWVYFVAKSKKFFLANSIDHPNDVFNQQFSLHHS